MKQIQEIQEIQEILKKRLSEDRYNHSVGAMKKAVELAKKYGENEKDAELAGLIHDIAKEMGKQEIEDYVKAHNIELDEIEKAQLNLAHGKIGANIAKEEFGANEKIQNAIKYHTMGNVAMNQFDKIIYIADKIEDTRTYEELEKVTELAGKSLDEAILYILDFTTQKCIRKQIAIHPDTILLRNHLLKAIS